MQLSFGVRFHEEEQIKTMKYYVVRISASLFFMGSFGGGFLAGAEYGKWIGWLTFIAMFATGIDLHNRAERMQTHRSE